MYTYSWAMLVYGRNQHNIIITLQLKINKLIKKEPNKKWVKDFNRHFSKDIGKANRYMKRWSTSLVNRELQIKTIMRYHLMLVEWPSLKTKGNKCWCGCGKKGTLVHL